MKTALAMAGKQIWGPVVWALSLVASSAGAQQLPTPHWKITRVQQQVSFSSADQMSVLAELEMMALTPEGAQGLTKAQVGYNASLERVDILEAKTIKADGRELPVQSNGMVTQKGLSSAGVGVTMPQWEVREINYPDVQVGDKVLRVVRRTSLQPRLPGWQAFEDYAPPSVAVDRATVRIEAPVGLSLSVASMPPLQRTVQGDKQVWMGEGSFPAAPLDDSASSLRRQIPHVQVSTLPTQEELATRFAQQLFERAVVTEEVRRLALSLGVQAGTDAQKLRAVYDWVRKEIKYVALYLGVEGWVPHDVAHILDKRYGDCKDHVTLMLALLKALGVEAQPALVNTYADYGWDPIGMGFNHVIVYVPGLDKFLDPTDRFTPYERLPYAVYGKPTAVSDGHRARVVRTPVLAAQDNSVVSTSRYVIAADGSAQMTLQVAAQGYAASLVQNQLQQIPAGMGWAAVQRILKQSGERGKGDLSFDAIDWDRPTQGFNATAEILGMLRNPESGATLVNPTLALPIYVYNNLGNYQQESRSQHYVCNSMRIREEFSLEFDPSFQLGRTPKPFKREIEGVRFEAHYSREGNRIDGWREILIEHAEQECSPQEYQRRRSTMLEIAQHLRTQVLYER